jgi:allantoin racemase
MRVLVLKPYAGRTREREHCQSVARPGTIVEFANLEGKFPIPHVHHRYVRYQAVDETLEHVLRAEQEGYDGVCIACGLDPGLLEARELVDIPVTGTFEAAGHVAATMGHKFSVVTTVSYAVPQMQELALQYGFGHKLASVRTLNIPGRKLYVDVTSPESVVQRINAVARQCVEEDGAEVIVLTATLAGTMFTEHTKSPITEVGAPLVDAMLVAFKQCEMMVDLKQLAGIPPVSRVNAFRSPYEPEYRRMREFLGRPLYRGLGPAAQTDEAAE